MSADSLTYLTDIQLAEKLAEMVNEAPKDMQPLLSVCADRLWAAGESRRRNF